MKERIAIQQGDIDCCICGEDVRFIVCDETGGQTIPDRPPKEQLYLCSGCGRIINRSGVVIGIKDFVECGEKLTIDGEETRITTAADLARRINVLEMEDCLYAYTLQGREREYAFAVQKQEFIGSLIVIIGGFGNKARCCWLPADTENMHDYLILELVQEYLRGWDVDPDEDYIAICEERGKRDFALTPREMQEGYKVQQRLYDVTEIREQLDDLVHCGHIEGAPDFDKILADNDLIDTIINEFKTYNTEEKVASDQDHWRASIAKHLRLEHFQ